MLRKLSQLAILVACSILTPASWAQVTITNLAVVAQTSTSATIAWTTSGPASSQVLFGINGILNSQTPLDSSLVTSHSQAITGIFSGSVFSYAAVSVDGGGNRTQSPTQTFALCSPSTGGYTQVSGTTNNFYEYGSYSISWVNESGHAITPTVCGAPIATTISGSLDSSGTLSVPVPDNLEVVPSPSQWTITVSSLGSLGIYTTPSTTITGVANNFNSVLSAGVVGKTSHCFVDQSTSTVYPTGCGGGGSSILLQTNGVDNGSQSKLNLIGGTNVTITDGGSGGVTIAATGGGGGDVFQNPTLAQTIIQPSRTQFNANTVNSIRYSQQFNWSQSPISPASLSAGSQTITINGVRGITALSASSFLHYIAIAGTGTPEYDLITATTCTGLTTGTCTITLTVTGSHSAGYTVGSASTGVQEAIVDATDYLAYVAPVGVSAGATVRVAPDNSTAIQATFNAPVDIENPALGIGGFNTAGVTLDLTGASVSCVVPGESCIRIGKVNAGATLNTVIKGGIISPGVGTNRTANGTTYAIRDYGQATLIWNVQIGAGAANGQPHYFDDGIRIDNDEDFTIYHLSTSGNGPGMKCDATYCGALIVLGTGAPTGRITNSTMNMAAQGNCVEGSGSTTGLIITGNICQAFNEFAYSVIQSFATTKTSMAGNYVEIGSTTNPTGTGQSTLIANGAEVSSSGWVAGMASTAPLFENVGHTGATTLFYYAVWHSSTLHAANVMECGRTTTDGTSNSVTIVCPEPDVAAQSVGTVTWDVIAESSTTTSAPNGTGNYGVSIGLSDSTCTSYPTGIHDPIRTCTTVVDPSVALTSYTVPAVQWLPAVNACVGAVCLGVNGTGNNVSQAATFQVDQSPGAIWSSLGPLYGSVYAMQCPLGGGVSISSGIWYNNVLYECLADGTTSSDSAQSYYESYTGAGGGGLSGRLIFGINTTPKTDILTLIDGNPPATAASNGARRPWDVNDAAIGTDDAASTAPASQHLSLHSPNSIHFTIGALPTGSNNQYSFGASTLTMPGATVTSLGGSGTLCIHTDNLGNLSVSGADCNSGGVSGSGTTGTLPVWTGSGAIGNSIVVQNAGSGKLLSTATGSASGLCSGSINEASGSVAWNSTGFVFDPTENANGSTVGFCLGSNTNGVGFRFRGADTTTTNNVGGPFTVQAGGDAVTTGAVLSAGGGGGSTEKGGAAGISGGSGHLGGDAVVASGGVTAGGTLAGNVALEVAQGSTASNDGVVYIRSTGSGTSYMYLGTSSFGNLGTPPTNPAYTTLGALIICTDCKGPQNGALVGSIAAGSGSGAVLYFDTTNWRVLGGVSGGTLSTITNCAATGTAANPSLVACSSASAGAFSCDVAASGTTCIVSTTAVTANSEIIVTEVADESSRLGVTCNTAPSVVPTILLAAKSAGTSFTINMPTITANPACFDYAIVN